MLLKRLRPLSRLHSDRKHQRQIDLLASARKENKADERAGVPSET